MKGEYRQRFANTLRITTEQAIARQDQAYGRQLATMFERYSLMLRAHFGGTPRWATSQRVRIKLRGATDG